jgi:hypothetical protein
MKLTFANILLTATYLNLISLCILASKYCEATEVENYQSQLKSIDEAHQSFTRNFYSQLIKTPTINTSKYSTIEALFQAVNIENERNNPVKAVALIIRNQLLLTRYYDSSETITLLEQLLANNVLMSTQIIMKSIKRLGDDNVNGQLNYLLAEFYFQRKEWPSVLSHLAKDTSELPLEQYHHALLMKGIALQKQGKHALSIKSYQKISVNARDYTAAQFNIALANIRQGWWTDGHDIISALLAEQQNTTQEKTLNRLYITLGYSLLNQAYYRNARKAFQLVGLNSRYNNQALLGIALTAAYQDDYLGALNATRFLKEKQEDDLPIDEAFLLMPFFYEKSQQLATASVGYSHAANYYQDKISTLTQLINAPIDLSTYPIERTNTITIQLNETHLNFTDNYPDYFFTQRQNIKQLKQFSSTTLSQSLSLINRQYDELTVKMAKSIMKNRVDQLNSYLNQSRYGLARLYDNNMVEQ